ncbi:MAG: hypothetical protein IPN29_19375 [Saprospiraceae bacterium]|nr:hypothetical protein [Saprospiraceae bacterium]
MRKVKTILTFITVISLFLPGRAQDLTANYQLAEQLFFHKLYDNALKEYLRVYYRDSTNLYAGACKKIAQCFLLRGDEKNAIRYLDIYFFKLPYLHAERNEVRYQKQKIFLLEKNYNKALVEILQVNKKSEPDLDRYFFMTGVNYLFADQYDKARSQFLKLRYAARIDTIQLNQSLKKLAKNQKKKPGLARWMSAVIPGSGQMVNGEIKDGLNSLGLFSAFAALYIDLIPDLGFGDATLTVGPWLIRYYLGGLGNAVRAAQNKKLNTKQKLIGEMVRNIERAKVH